jgi:hypothetical protein
LYRLPDSFAMLTPVSSNMPASSNTIGQQAALRGHGSAPRDTTNHGQVEAQVVTQGPHYGMTIGIEAGTVLSQVNAVAATAGSRTVLQMLALAVAAQVNIARRNDESMEAFFLRLAAVLENMKPDEQAATEARTGLKLLRISLPELAAALKQPDSAMAARLTAMAEAPMATPQKTAAASATISYLQEEPGAARAAETQAMVNQAKANTPASGLFSSATHSLGSEAQAADAKGLQGQLKTLFEPGMGETQDEIAAAADEPTVLILGSAADFSDEIVEAKAEPKIAPMKSAANPDQPLTEPEQAQPVQTPSTTAPAQQTVAADSEAAAEPQQNTTMPAEPEMIEAEPANSATAQSPRTEARNSAPSVEAELPGEDKTPASTTAKPDQKSAEQPAQPRSQTLLSAQNTGLTPAMRIRVIALELAQANVISLGDEPRMEDKSGRQVQTLLALKGIAEVTTVPVKSAEMPAGNPLRTTQSQLQAALANEASGAGTDLPADIDADARSQSANRDVTTVHTTARQAIPLAMAETQETATAAHAKASGESQSGARSADPEALAQARQAANAFHPVPYAYATLQMATDEFKPETIDDRRRDDDEDGSQGQEREDEDARRERLARKATDDLLRPEPDAEPALNITRDSSQADRAYALYQRMGGF